jgi:hypothetical protein
MRTITVLAGSVLVSTLFLGTGFFIKATAASDQEVLAVCGPNGAARIVSADKVPSGCHALTVNAPPSHG